MTDLYRYYHWYYHIQNKKGSLNISTGLFFWLFLSITLPFGIYNTNVPYLSLSLYLFPIALIWVLISYGTDRFFSSVLNIDLKEDPALDKFNTALKLLLIIHIIFLIRGALCRWSCVDLMEYAQMYFAFLMMFGFCYLLYALHARNLYFQSMLGGDLGPEHEIQLRSQGKEILNIDPRMILYIKADDNYVDIHFISEGKLKTHALRSSLSFIEKQLIKLSSFQRIHRSYIANIRYKKTYSRTRMALELDVEGETIPLPVSKKYRSRLDRIFIHPN